MVGISEQSSRHLGSAYAERSVMTRISFIVARIMPTKSSVSISTPESPCSICADLAPTLGTNMPIRPQPIRIQCRHCGWQTTYAPHSDALMELMPKTCAKCGSDQLDTSPAGLLEGALSSMSSLLRGKARPR